MGNQGHEAHGAMISLGGVRPVSAMASIAVGGTTAAAHTVVFAATKRVAVLVIGGSHGDFRITTNETADAVDWPLLKDAYYYCSVGKGDTVNVYNTTGGALTVYFLELY